MSAVKPATLSLEKNQRVQTNSSQTTQDGGTGKSYCYVPPSCALFKSGSLTSATENKLLDIEGYRNRKYPRPKWVAIE